MRPIRIRGISMKTKRILQSILALSGSFSLVMTFAAVMERMHLASNDLYWTICPSVILAVFIALSIYAFHTGIWSKNANAPKKAAVLRCVEGIFCLLCGIALALALFFMIVQNEATISNYGMALKIISSMILLTFVITATIYIVNFGVLNKKIEKYGYWMLHLRNAEIAFIWFLAPIGLGIKMHWALNIFLYPVCTLILLAGILLAVIFNKK